MNGPGGDGGGGETPRQQGQSGAQSRASKAPITRSAMHRPLVILLALTAGACASSGAIPRPFPVPGGGPPPPEAAAPAPAPAPAATAEAGYAIAGTALSLRGTPYHNGGTDPAGFDCSGFVWYVFREHGVQVPRTVSELYRAGTGIGGGDLRAGDLVFFDTTGGGPSHVGISIG